MLICACNVSDQGFFNPRCELEKDKPVCTSIICITGNRSSCNDLRPSCSDFRSSCNELRPSCSDFRSSCNELRPSCSDYRSSCKDYRSSCSDFHSSCNELRSSCSDYRSSCNELRSSCNDYHSSCNNIKETVQGTAPVIRVCICLRSPEPDGGNGVNRRARLGHKHELPSRGCRK